MNWNVVAGRTKLFAFIWGALVFGAVSPSFFGLHGGYTADHPVPHDAVEAVLSVCLTGIILCCFGALPALLYAFLLGFYQRDKTERQNKSFLVPMLICAVYELPLFAWLATGPGAAYGPDGWLNGGYRIGAAGYVAALVAGYFVSRHPVEKWKQRSKSAPVIFVLGVIIAFWLISAALFPTFQAVRAV